MTIGSLLAKARIRTPARSRSTRSTSPATVTGASTSAMTDPFSWTGQGQTQLWPRRSAWARDQRQGDDSGLRTGELQLGQLVDLGGELGQGGVEAGDVAAGRTLVVVVGDVLDGVLGVGLEVLGPVEDVVHEVLRVVDDVLDEPGEGVLALRHGGIPFGFSSRPYASRN